MDDLGAPRLASDDHHHLARVLRLAPGTELTAGDGAGRWRLCRLGESKDDLVVAGEIVEDRRPGPLLTVAFALVKGDRPELVVQKLTELGVDRIVPFAAERSVVRWEPGKADRQLARLRSIARQAAMQCRRTWLPDVGIAEPGGDAASRLAGFATVAELPGAAMADRGGEPPTMATPTLLVGPEGGWGTTERSVGIPRVRLSEHVLRAETAALTAGALLGALRSELVR